MEEKLIALVKNKKFLYDKSRSSYKKLDVKEAAWKEISNELNKIVEQIQKRWKTLRDRYARERKNMFTPSGSAAISPKNKWKYFEQLSFLSDIPETNYRTISNYEHEVEDSTGSCYEAVESGLQMDEDGSILFDESFGTSDNFPLSGTSCSSTISPQTALLEEDVERPQPGKRRKRNLDSEILLQNTHREMSQFLKEAKSVFKENSSNMSSLDLFFSGLSSDIQKSGMTFQQRSALQIKLMTLVHEEINKVQNVN